MPSSTNSKIPAWYPAWARQLSEVYLSGTSNMFILHGNIHDLQPVQTPEANRLDYVLVEEFLSEQVFGNWDLVLGYDLTSEPKPLCGTNRERLGKMREIMSRYADPRAPMAREPAGAIVALDRLIERVLLLPDKDSPAPIKVALIFTGAELLAPDQDIAQMASRLAGQVETLQKWARNPYLKRINVCFCLLCERQADLTDRLVRNPHTVSIRIPYPDEENRAQFIRVLDPKREAPLLAKKTSGLTLVNLRALVLRTQESDDHLLKQFKKEMIERQCGNFIEFIEPSSSFDWVVGQEAAKEQLLQDALLIKEGRLETAPMGYLLCGPVGTGKSFLAECYAATIGLPCIKLLNFRSKYVGETEGNLELILSVLRVMGPVVVMIDEADASLGNRDQGGDSGTGSRVFAQIAAQMGDTRYRGKIIWFLMTSRPEALPIDLKRQGRAEVHIPLFYPETLDEQRAMFAAMAKKNKIALAPDALEFLTEKKDFSGADIESILTKSWRKTLLNRADTLSKEVLAETTGSFIPSAQSAEKEYQTLTAALECTDIKFLPERLREMFVNPEKRREIQTRLWDLKNRLGTKV